MSASQLSNANVNVRSVDRLPPFEAVKAIFAEEEVDGKRKRNGTNRVDLKDDSVSEDGSEEDGSEDEGTRHEQMSSKRSKSELKSGIFAKASNTRIVRQVLHAHAMIDSEETDGKDMVLDDLPFNLLVAGELEIILNKVGAEEKWSRLMMLKKLAYKSQFLKHEAILERYAAFLHKVEKGKCNWGSEQALRELDEALRFRTFTTLREGGQERNDKFKGDTGRRGNDNRIQGRKVYCSDYNKGTCMYPNTPDGRFSRMNVKK